MAWGKYLRVRVLINITKPLKRGQRVVVEGGKKIRTTFKYERLPDFCYVCGMPDHQEQECNEAIRIMKAKKSSVSLVHG
ncbi:hypothetical protein DITRI_Ditri02bG0122400 [Diplodiscus trichospermus]